jgi:hypothetical protein
MSFVSQASLIAAQAYSTQQKHGAKPQNQFSPIEQEDAPRATLRRRAADDRDFIQFDLSEVAKSNLSDVAAAVGAAGADEQGQTPSTETAGAAEQRERLLAREAPNATARPRFQQPGAQLDIRV